MFRLLFFLLLLIFSRHINGQKEVFLNAIFKKTSEKKAIYVATVKQPHKDSLYSIDVYWYPNRVLKSKGKYSREIPLDEHAEGPVTKYLGNGKIMTYSVFSKGKLTYHEHYSAGEKEYQYYIKDKMKEGLYVEFMANGDTSCVKHYSKDALNGSYTSYFKNNKVSLKTTYVNGEKDGHFVNYFSPDSINSEGDYILGKKTGAWTYYHKNGRIASREKYADNRIISAELFSEDGLPENLPDSLHWLDKWPQYIGGEKAMSKILSENVKYPTEALENNIKGIVYVELEINMKGEVVSNKVLRSPHPLLTKTAVDATEKLVKFDPGLNHNRKHNVTMVIPVKFILQ